MTDTDPQTAAIYHQLLQSRTPAERFAMGLRMCAAARATVLASLPPLSEVDRKIALLHRYYGDDFSPQELARIARAIRTNQPLSP